MTNVSESRDPADLPRVLEVLRLAFAAHAGRVDPPSGVEHETVASLQARLENEALVVARTEGGIAGCIWCRPQPNRHLYIGRLAVDPAFAGRGIGGLLLDASIQRARALSSPAVDLNVRVELTENIAMFERRGFVIAGAESHPGFDRPTNYHMRLTLQGPGAVPTAAVP
ncbi:MAG: GNAT family N-acetyltransferase [Dehalococcoidia bacterium]